MIYLATPVHPAVWPLVAAGRIGVMYSFTAYRPRSHHNLAGIHVGIDNGCFARPDLFDFGRYVEWLATMPEALFATAPDVVGDAVTTWDRSAPAFDAIRATGQPPALVAQDGFDPDVIDWTAFDALFVGGTTEWKLTRGYELAALAHEHGKWAHIGRVNSGRRYRAARAAGFDSADGSFLAFAPEANVARMLTWFCQAEREPTLWETVPERET